MKVINLTFAMLFKKYRLRAEFESLKELSDELMQENLIYEKSVFSRWQKGERVPTDRRVLLTLIKLFIQKNSISTLKEANEFLATAGQGYLTDEEVECLPITLLAAAPFQVPREIAAFTGRESYVNNIKSLLLGNTTVVIHGQAGIGKTSLAIKLAHELRTEFPDGVLWYRVDTSSPSQILASIAYTYGKDITAIQDVNSRASLVRSILAHKKALIIYDNVEKDSRLDLLLPNTHSVAVLITSRYQTIETFHKQSVIPVTVFNDKEALSLIQHVHGVAYVKKNKERLTEILQRVGYLPLAIHILAKHMLQPTQTPQKILLLLEKEYIRLSAFTYEHKNLYAALHISFNNLDSELQQLFISLGVFSGTDFTLAAVAYINNVSQHQAKLILAELIHHSLVERSVEGKYRLHPMIKKYVSEKHQPPLLYKRAGRYYATYLKKSKNKKLQCYVYIRKEIENILAIYEKNHEFCHWNEVISIGEGLIEFLIDSELWVELASFSQKIYDAATATNNLKVKAWCCIEGFSWFYDVSYKKKLAESYATEALNLSLQIQDDYLIAYAKEALGRVYQMSKRIPESLELLHEALHYFKKHNHYILIFNTLLYISDAYCHQYQLEKAIPVLYEALEALHKMKNVQLEVIETPRIYVRLGFIYLIQKDYNKAKDFFEMSIELNKKSTAIITTCIWDHLGMGFLYEDLKDVKTAKKFFDQAYKEMVQLNMNHEYLKKEGAFLQIEDVMERSTLYKPYF